MVIADKCKDSSHEIKSEINSNAKHGTRTERLMAEQLMTEQLMTEQLMTE